MHANDLTLSQWIDRCTMRLGALLPAMDPTEAAQRAAAMADDAYPLQPEHAAEVYLELPDLPVEALSDRDKFEFSTWTLGYVFDDDTPPSDLAVQAAAAVLKAEGVDPVAGMNAQFKLECWDDSDMAKELELTAEDHRAQRAWIRASLAADAAYPVSSGEHSRGHLVMMSQSKARWEAARARWLADRHVDA